MIRMNTKKKLGKLMAGALIICLGVSVTGCSTRERVEEEILERPVRRIKVEENTYSKTLKYNGEIVPEKTLRISFQVSGRIQDLYAEKEDYVQTDTLLARIDPRDYELSLESAKARLNAAQASLDQALAGARGEEIRQTELEVEKAREAADFARKQLERIQALHDSGAASTVELDQAAMEAAASQSELEQAEAELEKVLEGVRQEEIQGLQAQRDAVRAEMQHYETRLKRTSLKAETAGRISDIYYEEGEIYVEGSPFLSLRSEGWMVKISVPRHEIAEINQGGPAEVIIDKEVYEGEITSVSHHPDPLTRTFPVEIKLTENEFIAGSIARVLIPGDEMEGTMLPVSAVQSGDPDYVYTVQEGKAVMTPVEIVGLSDNQLYVRGLGIGQEVVVEGMGNLEDGEPVRIKEAGDSS